MFPGLWLRICFGFGSQQQTITITTPGRTDVQFVPTPSQDYRHSCATFLSFSHCDSFFCRYFPECAQFRSFTRSRSELGTGQVSLRRGNAQRLSRPPIRASIRQAIAGVGSLAGSRANPIVRHFPSLRHLTPRQNSLPELPRPQHAGSVPCDPGPPQHYQAPQQYAGTPNFHAPVQPPPPKQKPAHSGPRIFHYSRCTGKKKAVCVRDFRNSRTCPCVELDVNECHIRLGWNQLRGHGQGIEWLCERCQERSQVSHEYV